MTRWRRIEGFPGYEVSDTGQVRSWLPIRNNAPWPSKPRLLSFKIDRDGYVVYGLMQNGRVRMRHAHVLVAQEFVDGYMPGLEVRHLDGSKRRNVPENLAWGTSQENAEDRVKHGTQIKGEGVNTAALTEEDVRLVLSSSEGHSALARKLGVTPTCIWMIRERRTWKHVRI